MLDFGAKNDGTGDAGAACTAAVASMNATVGGTLIFPAGTYNFTTPCLIKSITNGILKINLSGANLTTTSVIAIFDRFPTDDADAQNMVSARVEIDGGFFTGNNQVGQYAIRLGATYSSHINGAVLNNFDIALDLQFSLNARVTNVRCFRSTTYCVTAREGQWSGATTNNSQSNAVVFENVRDYSLIGQIASFYIHGSDGVIIRNGICEGENPVQCILNNDDRAATVKSFKVDGLHVENTASNSIITIVGSGGGVMTFENIFNQTTPTFIDATAHDNGVINVIDTNYTGAFPHSNDTFLVINGDAHVWVFRNWQTASLAITNPVWWSGGHVPSSLLSLGANGSVGTLNYNVLSFGNPLAAPNYTQSSQFFGTLGFGADDTYGIGTATSGTGLLRPHIVSIGTGGLNTAGPIVSNITGSTQCLKVDTTGTIFGTGSACAATSLTSAHLFIGNVSNVPTDVALSGDCSIDNIGAITCTKTNGSSFVASATIDTTNASNISSGTLASARGGAGAVSGALKGNGSGAVSQAACADLSNGAAGCSTAAVTATYPQAASAFAI
ncbi:MAG: hypothetical protein KGL39_30860, partial [Patescibacteria group bacterium]|nr:hypothetical protein [Patescibacteria group bacterium]